MTPARKLYEDALCHVKIPFDQIESGDDCLLCGYPYDIMYSVKDVIGVSFTDHADITCPESPVICAPCTWTLSGRPPDTFRLWSAVWRTDRKPKPSHKKVTPNRKSKWVHLTNYEDLSEVIDILINPPKSTWFCCVAITSKVHIVPFGKLISERDSWVIRADKKYVHGNPKRLGILLNTVAKLYAVGYTRDEIIHMNPHPSKVAKDISLWKKYVDITQTSEHLIELTTFLVRRNAINDTIQNTRRFL